MKNKIYGNSYEIHSNFKFKEIKRDIKIFGNQSSFKFEKVHFEKVISEIIVNNGTFVSHEIAEEIIPAPKMRAYEYEFLRLQHKNKSKIFISNNHDLKITDKNNKYFNQNNS